MKMINFLRVLLNESGMDGMYRFAPGERHVELVAAQSQIANLIAAYDALAPDWLQAPDWAKWYAAIAQMIAAYDALAPKPDAWPDGAEWYTIDAENQCYWHIDEPALFDWAWDSNGLDWAGFVDIPLGVDWRLCKWQRPEVAA